MKISTLLKVNIIHVITAKLLGYHDKVEHSCKIGTRVCVRERESLEWEREREKRERGEGGWGIEKGNNCGWTPMMKGCGRYTWTALQSATKNQSKHNHSWAAPLKLTPSSCSICNHKLVCFELVMRTANSKLCILISKSAWWSCQLNIYEEPPLHKVDLM
jgi:hypothetical protein